ncbi:peptidase C1B, bleomycin hydrolase [Lentinula aciculospora]|uniref:Cysteine proteinase 1, mitochondrial n=1 Tax=Lentinula aciculospora TaxID=153920 RepID=A0A9W8ZVV1_9AGAR|nr:peptidase C1B, bleomycin hydrolase [Lentinula aciculospora]
MGSSPSKPLTTPSTSQKLYIESEKKTVAENADAFSVLSVATPTSVNGSISLQNVSSWESDIVHDPKARLARTVLSHSDIRDALVSRKATIATTHIFNHEIDFKTGPITNQKSSGRCWLFATTNVLRYDVMKKLKLKDFQLSQLNKSNYYLELMIENADLPVDDRVINHLSGDLISDGGQWDMAVNLIETYGVVPQSIYPESFHSSSSSPLNALLKTKLREDALILRKLTADLKAAGASALVAVSAARAEKEKLMKEIYTIMTAALGVPPLPDASFTWEYYDETGKFGTWSGTPLDYYKTFAAKAYPAKDSFSLINDPRNDYSQLITIEKLGNIWGGRPVLYVNTSIDIMKAAVVKMVKAGVPVFFGCDVGKSSERNLGLMDTTLFQYEDTFDITLGLTKAQRLEINESAMTHAMVISGVHLDTNGKLVRYKVENSWGDAPGNKGYFVMTDDWFNEFVYQVVVPKSMAPKDLVAVFEGGNAKVLPPWDPMLFHAAYGAIADVQTEIGL